MDLTTWQNYFIVMCFLCSNAVPKAGCRWRWRSWKELSFDLVHNQQLSPGICPDCIRQLCRKYHVQRTAIYPGTMGYCRPGKDICMWTSEPDLDLGQEYPGQWFTTLGLRLI